MLSLRVERDIQRMGNKSEFGCPVRQQAPWAGFLCEKSGNLRLSVFLSVSSVHEVPVNFFFFYELPSSWHQYFQSCGQTVVTESTNLIHKSVTAPSNECCIWWRGGNVVRETIFIYENECLTKGRVVSVFPSIVAVVEDCTQSFYTSLLA